MNRPGRILSVHYDSLATYRGDIEVEPFIYSVLVDLKLSNPYPVIHDIQEKQFAAVLLAEDIFVEKKGEPDPEAPYLTGQHMAALRANYKLTTKIDGPYGIYVYEPIRN